MSLRVGHLQSGVSAESGSTERKGDKRPALWNRLFSMKDHESIIRVQMPTVAKRKETASYLNGLHHDIRLLEGHLQKHRLHFDTLPLLFREEAIRQDLQAIRTEEEMADLVKIYDHEGHFNSIAGKPHLLLAHLSVHYLGFLSGGQALAPKYSKNFGEDTVHLYDYKDQNPHGLMNRFLVEVEGYLQGLPPEENQAFQEEVRLGWIFICDLFGANIRKAKSCCSCIQRIWKKVF